jgi:glutaredoxin
VFASLRTATFSEERARERCPYCARARAFFKRQGIQYAEHDIERDPGADAEYRSLGGRGIPFILVGEDVVRGFNEPQLRSLLGPWLARQRG